MKEFLSKAFSLNTANKVFAFENLIPVAILSIVAWYISYASGLATSYNDAMAHVNLSRMVIDNQEPGMAQIGTVWLPLNHILPLVFVWNEWAWRSGFAGSFFSMAAYVISVWAIFKTVFTITRHKIAALIGSLVFAFNLNILYIQTTPLTEALYIGLFSLSMMVFALYLTEKQNAKYLLILGVLGFFQVITRYDGWFVVIAQALFILVNEYTLVKRSIQETIGKLFLFGLPVILGMGLWFTWNGLIFGNPLYFIFGEYSAHSQQTLIAEKAGLETKGNIGLSFMTYMYTMIHNVGHFILTYALFGLATLLLFVKRIDFKKKLLFVGALISPIVFNILSLFLGFSTINVPEINSDHINPTEQWFNVRYGLLALPFAAVLVGIFASWKKLAAALAVVMIVVQGYAMYTNGLITVADGTKGLSAFNNHKASEELSVLVQPDETVIMSMAYFSATAFKSDVQLKQVVHEGVSKKWNQALQNPQNYAEWIVMSSTESRGDPVYGKLVVEQKSAFLTQYDIVYSDAETSIYRLKDNKKVALLGVNK